MVYSRCVSLLPSQARARLCHATAPSIPRYVPQDVESKWQAIWRDSPVAKLAEDDTREKFYVLSMFPYPSGLLHMGHVRVYAISDSLAHYHRMRGKKVLHPMGWDSFGLPAENAAIDNAISPTVWTQQNISQMKAQQMSLGLQFDWDKELSTCSPDYYRWTQWLFLQLYKHGVAYQKEALVNWDPVDCSVLANEQVDHNGRSWRSGARVEQRYLKQWFLKISSYSERLLSGLDELHWPDRIKNAQANWIKRSEGASFEFKIQNDSGCGSLKVFTTRPETLYGVSYLAVSPDHEMIREGKLVSPAIVSQVNQLFLNRGHTDDRAGLDLGVRVTHPLSGTSLPVYVADYVVDYGTNTVMGVPSVDKRDRAFATAHDLPILTVIDNKVLVNSAQFNGMYPEEGRKAIIEHAKAMGCGGPMTNYRLRDWLISRQRYWGAPIPMLHCQKCGVVPVPEDQLPVCLPDDVQLTGRGPSPLLKSTQWLNSGTCGKPGCTAQRDPDTMDTFVDSSWYFLRYIDPHNQTRPFEPHLADQWMPVDIYVGGAEHAVLHHLYARFITHFLADAGFIKHSEPFKRLVNQGMVMTKTYRLTGSGQYLLPEEAEKMIRDGREKELVSSWEKMSKSKHNGVNPADLIQQYGADTVRLYVLKYNALTDVKLDDRGIRDMHELLHNVWNIVHGHITACSRLTAGSDEREQLSDARKNEIMSVTTKAIREVTSSFNSNINMGVRSIVDLLRYLRLSDLSSSGDRDHVMVSSDYHSSLTTLIQLMSPLAPHITSQLWEDMKPAGRILGVPVSDRGVLDQSWPHCPEIKLDQVNLSIRVNGVWQESIQVSSVSSDESLIAAAMKSPSVQGLLHEGTTINRTIMIPSQNPSWRGINIVTKTLR